jgi:hypothetical protein
VGGGRQIFELLASEDVDSDQVDLGVTVLSRLGGRHVDNLAGTTLDHNVTVLTQSRALHREGSGGTGIGAVEGVLVLLGRLSMLACVQKSRGRQDCVAQAEEGESDRGGALRSQGRPRGNDEHTWASLSAMVTDGYEEVGLMEVWRVSDGREDGRDKKRVKGVSEWEGGGKGKKRHRRAMGVGREADQKLFSSFFLPLGRFGHEPQCCGGDLLLFLLLIVDIHHQSPGLYLSVEYYPSTIL